MPGFLQVLALPVIVKGANVSVEVILGGPYRSDTAQAKEGGRGEKAHLRHVVGLRGAGGVLHVLGEGIRRRATWPTPHRPR